jgi:hypothetical protein
VSGKVHLAAGRHTAFRLSAAGAVTEEKQVTLPAAVTASADQRQRFRNRGIHYRLTSGQLAGFWVAEQPPRRYLLGQHLQTVYATPRVLTLAAGAHSAVTLDRAGRVATARSPRLARGTAVRVTRTALVDGRLRAFVPTGPLARSWVTVGPTATLR